MTLILADKINPVGSLESQIGAPQDWYQAFLQARDLEKDRYAAMRWLMADSGYQNFDPQAICKPF